jgi:transposase
MANGKGFAMAAPIALRGDFDAARLRGLAKASSDANQTRRLLALAVIYDGGTRRAAAQLGGVGLQTVRDWVLAFNGEGPAGLIDGKAPGKPALLDVAQRRALAAIVDAGPSPAIHGVVGWRLIDLVQWVYESFSIAISPQAVSDTLRAMGYRKLTARPRHHEQNTEALTDFKKASPSALRTSPNAKRGAGRSRSGGKTKLA